METKVRVDMVRAIHDDLLKFGHSEKDTKFDKNLPLKI